MASTATSFKFRFFKKSRVPQKFPKGSITSFVKVAQQSSCIILQLSDYNRGSINTADNPKGVSLSKTLVHLCKTSFCFQEKSVKNPWTSYCFEKSGTLSQKSDTPLGTTEHLFLNTIKYTWSWLVYLVEFNPSSSSAILFRLPIPLSEINKIYLLQSNCCQIHLVKFSFNHAFLWELARNRIWTILS